MPYRLRFGIHTICRRFCTKAVQWKCMNFGLNACMCLEINMKTINFRFTCLINIVMPFSPKINMHDDAGFQYYIHADNFALAIKWHIVNSKQRHLLQFCRFECCTEQGFSIANKIKLIPLELLNCSLRIFYFIVSKCSGATNFSNRQNVRLIPMF